MQAYSVTKFGSLILPFPYFITMYSEMTYMRTTARNLVVMYFISLQLSWLSGGEKQGWCYEEQDKENIRKGNMHFHYSNINKYKR